jgi:schlafen family protein
MAIPSLAQAFFDRIKDSPDPVAFLESLTDPSAPATEEEYLEFKCVPQNNDRSLKEAWSKSLSGFANTSGGVLIWGIKATRLPGKKVDCACDTCLVDDPGELKTQLNALSRQATDPPVPGVLIETYSEPETSKGFVICMIPQSEFCPHRAEYVENKPYYLRVNDNFMVMPAAVLRSMFYPRPKPYLRVYISVRSRRNDLGTPVSWDWLMRIENSGTATARDLVIFVHSPLAFNDLYLSPDCSPCRMASGAYSILCNRAIHPGGHLDVVTYSDPQKDFTSRAETTIFVDMWSSDNEPQGAMVSFKRTEVETLEADGKGKYGVTGKRPKNASSPA